MRITITKGQLSVRVSTAISIATLETLALLGYSILIDGDKQ